MQALLWLWVGVILSTCHSARILGLFTAEGKSNFGFHIAMMRSLLKAGHQVTVVAPFTPLNIHENFTIVNSKTEQPEGSNEQTIVSVARTDTSWFSFHLQWLDILERRCRHATRLLKDMKEPKNFDVMFVEMLPMYQCYLPMAAKLAIPVIGTASTRSFFNSDDSVANPRFPSTFPTEYVFVNTKMTFYQRLLNVVKEIELRILRFLEDKKLKKFFREHYPAREDPQTDETSLIFVNDHVSLLPRVTVANAVGIGGIHIKMASLNLLPQELKAFIEGAEHGVILFSLGSVFSEQTLDAEIVVVLKNTFAKLPQRVLWKIDHHQIEGLSENVLLGEWMPQKEILAHNNVVLFISHCGLSSTYEAIYFGKPMILLPIFADQPGNAGILSSLKVGVYLNLLELTENKLLDAINLVINGSEYRRNMEELSQKFKDEPHSSEYLVVYWTEYILRNGGTSHLRSSAVDMPVLKYFLLDIIAFLITMAVVVRFLVIFMTKQLFCMIKNFNFQFYKLHQKN